MKAKEFLKEYYDPAGDDHSRRVKGDTRRPKLTLRHLNKLRKVREMRRLEIAKRKEFLPDMYGRPEPEA